MGVFDGGVINSEAGALLLGRPTGDQVGWRIAATFSDRREAENIAHTVTTLVGQPPFAIALGYADLNDHDELQRDTVIAVLAGKKVRRKRCAPVAEKSWPQGPPGTMSCLPSPTSCRGCVGHLGDRL